MHANDADHVVPAENCTCGVYAFWTVGELPDQYPDLPAHRRGRSHGGPDHRGRQRGEGQRGEIVAWWCAEDAAELATACAASAPGTRRYFDRDVMLGLYPAPQKPEEPEEENQDG